MSADDFKAIVKKDVKSLFNLSDDQAVENFMRDYDGQLERIFGLFLPDETVFDEDAWTKDKWDAGKACGYEFNDQQTMATPVALGNKPYIKKLKAPEQINPDRQWKEKAVKWLFTSKHENWNISRAGRGVKRILYDYGASEENRDLCKQFEAFLNAFGDDPLQHKELKNCNSYKDISILFHICYPQFFPPFYTGTQSGYNQITGMKILLDLLKSDLSNSLNFYDYEQYSMVYRIFLWGFHQWVEIKKIFQRKETLHWDYLVYFLAEMETMTNAHKLLQRKKALILYGVPGTGKTYQAEKLASELSGPRNKQHGYDSKDDKTETGKKYYEVLQLHPNYTYQDFVIGIRPQSNEDKITYPLVPGPLYRACAQAARNSENKYTLILDEINRADLSQVFGELMYCLEYRHKELPLAQTAGSIDGIEPIFKTSENEKSTIDDPFEGGKKFYIPDNLYFIGTMNTADKSLSGFDIALRRRFGWYKSTYSKNGLRECINNLCEKEGEKIKSSIVVDNVEQFVQKSQELNNHINDDKDGLGLSEDHEIGHTYFSEIVHILISDEIQHKPSQSDILLTITDYHLRILWQYHILPLLEEYLGFELATKKEKLQSVENTFCQLGK